MLTTRRDAIRYLSTAVAVPTWLRGAEGDRLRFTGLDHAQFEVRDGAAAAKFYARLFGGPVWKDRQAARWYVVLGRSYLVLEQSAEKAGRIDHFALGVAGFEAETVRRYLAARQMAGVLIAATEGPSVELVAENSWTTVEAQAQKDESLPTEPGLFRPTFLRNAVVGVKNFAPVRNFYRTVLGDDTAPDSKSLFDAGESKIDIRVTQPGQTNSETQIGVRVARFDVGEMQDALQATEAEVLLAHTPPSITLRDPNGFLLEITG